jgi:ElaB/YqjD/DUF883 family membrane-anchored ribosome-binding protein
MQSPNRSTTNPVTPGQHLQDSKDHTLKKPQDAGISTQVQERVQEMGTQVRDWAEEVGGQIKDSVQGAMHQVSTSAVQLSEQGRAAVGEFEKTLEDSIRRKPLQAVLIAAGIGMFAGLLWRK